MKLFKKAALIILVVCCIAAGFALAACDNAPAANNDAPAQSVGASVAPSAAQSGQGETDTDSAPVSVHTHNYVAVMTPPTCTAQGYTTYTCACGDTYIDDYVGATGHDFEFVRFEWDGFTAKALYECSHNCGEGNFAAATVTSQTTAPTCENGGLTTYTATFDGHTETKTEELTATGHDYGEPAWAWNGYESATATFTCKNDNTHVVTLNATIYVMTQRPTYEADGLETYTASATIDGKTYTDVTTKTLDKLIEGTQADIIAAGFTADGQGNYYTSVSNEAEVFRFVENVSVSVGAIWVLSLDEYGVHTVITKTLPLEIGDNVAYVIVASGDGQTVTAYKMTVRRKPLYTVTFDTNGGTAVGSQTVEEGYVATEPSVPEKAGYTFVKWSFDFDSPITADTRISAVWQANTDTPYKVEYYLQNLENDNYTLTETVSLTGTTDTTATAEIKTYDHFTHVTISASKERDNINGNGQAVLKVYYTRDKYSVNISSTNGVVLDKSYSGQYKYGTNIGVVTATFDEKIGYEWQGWFDGDKLLTDGMTLAAFTVDCDVTYTAIASVLPEYKPFDFTSTVDICTITGIKDKSVTTIVIPDGVTNIGFEAFAICSSLTSITIPDSVTSIGNYAFCDCSGLTSVTVGDGVMSIGSYAFYNCSSLTSVTIPDGVTSIGYAVFYNCSSLTSIVIPDGVTSIGSYAFSYCSSLTSVTIPDGVTSIGEDAFCYCSSLTSITIPEGVTSIGNHAFYRCSSLTSVTFKNTSGWYVSRSSSATSGTDVDVTNAAQNATYLKSTYRDYYWKRKTT